MANIKQALGGTAAIVCVLTSTANYASRETTAVDNTANLYLDAALMVQLQMSAIPVGDCWVGISTALNTTYSTPATGTDAVIVMPQIDKFGGEVMGQQHAGTDIIVLGKVSCPSSLTITGTAVANFGSVAAALGGNLTPKWGLTVTNASGAALGSTAGNHLLWYDGIYATSV